MHKIWIITLHPEFFKPLIDCGVVGSALRGERNIQFEVNLLQLRDYSKDKHHSVDDSPYGGGAGMVLRADVLKNALTDGVLKLGAYHSMDDLHVIYTAARGELWNQERAIHFASKHWANQSKDLVFICGRFEGVDERFLNKYVDECICVGDFILSGGEIAVMTIIDSAMRFVPGVLGNKVSATDESFFNHLLEYPQYTRPAEFEGELIPGVLTSGHHKKIDEFRLEAQKKLTQKMRPDLWDLHEQAP